MRPTVLLDVDGPLANFTRALLDECEALTGIHREVNEVDRWSVHECPWFADDAAAFGVSVAELKARVEEAVTLSGFCSEIPVQPGAQEAVARISEVADVFCVTSPWWSSRTWMHERTEWLHKHFGIKSKHVIHAQTKHLIRGDVFVDDKPEHVVGWRDAWPDGHAVLFEMHHNGHVGPGLFRGDWETVMGAVAIKSSGIEAAE
jgi:5'(3')-deoxyribonucleotidase